MPEPQPIPPGYEETSASSYPWTGRERSWNTGEAAVLLTLAAAGGDLTAHRTIHLGEKEANMPIPFTEQAVTEPVVTELAVTEQAVIERYKGVRGRQGRAAMLLADLARLELPSVAWTISDIGIQPKLFGLIERGELDAPAAERNRMRAAAFEMWADHLDAEITTRDWSDGTLELIVQTCLSGVEIHIFTTIQPADSSGPASA
ncbi:hypothetical protein ETD83_39680 [Actinomadura soli]|uniref:Uncharacterized protein n=1 Tax=Actinomadura soli TaxID=2508997 RepID=A0A5C4IZ30_9ACTN|nr:hypothetical protein [Actinomadura soli]TMQ87880.1 hypothetical protein ETD83_39680 [Actinomadura soli]